MRILILNWRDIKHPHQGGAEKVTFEHAKAWIKAGHQVVWFSSAFEKGKNEETVEGIKIIRRGGELVTVHLAAFFWYLQNGRSRFDLVVDQFHGLPFLTPLYVAEKKLAFIHEVTRELWFLNPLPKPFNFLAGFLGYFLEPWLLKAYRQTPFFTVSDSTKKGLVDLGISKKNITVIHNGIRIVRPKPFPVKEKLATFVFLGSLDKDKGIEDAIKAFGLINKKKKNCQFWVIGRGGPLYLKKLKSMAEALGIKKKVRFWGFVSEKKKFALLARAHLLFNPSVREGWGLVVIEANGVGTPTIAYNSPGLRDSVVHQKTGIICRRNSPGDLSDEALFLMANKKLYRRLRQGALKWAHQFNWQLSTKKSLKLIESLVKAK